MARTYFCRAYDLLADFIMITAGDVRDGEKGDTDDENVPLGIAGVESPRKKRRRIAPRKVHFRSGIIGFLLSIRAEMPGKIVVFNCMYVCM